MPQFYNVTLIQDISEWVAPIEADLNQILAHYHPQEYLSQERVLEWIIREEIELLYGLSCIGHLLKLNPHRRIHSRLDRALPVALNTLTLAYLKAPKLYNDNVFIQVDLRGTDLYIQYYKHGMQSALTFPVP